MGSELTVPEAARELIARLRASAPVPIPTPSVIPTGKPFYGVRIPELRRIAAAWVRQHRGLPPLFVRQLAEALWEQDIREEMILAGMLLDRRPDARELVSEEVLDRWAPSLDNWETVDNLASDVTGPWLAAAPGDRLAYIQKLTHSPHPWSRRLGLVSAIELSKRDSARQWWPEVSRMIDELARDQEGALPKAISWTLRSFARTAPREVEEYLSARGGRLPAAAVRETRNWLAAGTKTGRAPVRR